MLYWNLSHQKSVRIHKHFTGVIIQPMPLVYLKDPKIQKMAAENQRNRIFILVLRSLNCMLWWGQWVL